MNTAETETLVREPTPALPIKRDRSTATLLLAGAALLVLGNGTHPADAEPSALSRLPLAGSPSWVLIHLAIAVGVLLVVGGLVALRDRFTSAAAVHAARLGATSAVIGGAALAFVFAALDGYGQHHLAKKWEATDTAGRTVLEGAATALEVADSGLAAFGIIAFFGLTLAAFGRAVLADPIVPRALGWAGLILGVAGLAAGVTFAFQGPTSLVINVLFRPVAMGSTLYFALLGVALRKR